ncbi:MAG: hypothetical protein IJG62_06935 [Synergistaceae bacterium]|nr:hypothetical protein [Synergistaceae bacterium]MBQ4418192.1 hypothetical protein [Synergistaceae bacterium]MBQ7569660.1 hypothetical protein [Synergistaceae bacterium]MBQ9581665.1 hypothetical protein [Synergistaceae bacterium]MBQ9897129.1 hypothetical protein [Synergistaceae bacterium]
MNNRYRHKPRVDWDKEIEKTERIKRRGIFMSVLSFCVAIAFIFGINKFSANNIEIPKSVLLAACFVVSCIILRAVIRHRANKRDKDLNNNININNQDVNSEI